MKFKITLGCQRHLHVLFYPLSLPLEVMLEHPDLPVKNPTQKTVNDFLNEYNGQAKSEVQVAGSSGASNFTVFAKPLLVWDRRWAYERALVA